MTESMYDIIVTAERREFYEPAQVAGLETHVGNTPLLPLRSLTEKISPRVQILAKAEWFNPGGSIKDRPALNIINKAKADGFLGNGKRLLDATSGNMGIAYATFGAALGIPITLTIPSNASAERLTVLRSLGAELELTDPLEGTDGAIVMARELATADPTRYYYANQYDNPANWEAHYKSTGPEILNQTGGCITHFVAGTGTSGTITGVGRYLREYDPTIQLIAVQPDSPFHGLEGLKHMPTAIKPGIYDPTQPDRTMLVSTESAYEMVKILAREEGLFVGISSAANTLAALRLAEEIDRGLIVTVFPDSGYKYISDKSLWE